MTDPLDLTRLRALTEADAEVLFAALENPAPMTAAELEDEALYRQTVRHCLDREEEMMFIDPLAMALDREARLRREIWTKESERRARALQGQLDQIEENEARRGQEKANDAFNRLIKGKPKLPAP
jgi:hypothetical protein